MKFKLFPVLFLAASVAVGAESFSLSFNQHATKNLFQTSAPVSDQISSLTVFLGSDRPGPTLLAEAGYSHFHRNPGLSFGALNVGIDYLRSAGTKSAFYLAAGGTGSLFRPEYAVFSSLSLDLIGAFKTYLTPTSILKIQFRGDYWAFRDSLFDFVSQVSTLSVDKFFRTRTTLKAEAGWKYKYFLHPFLSIPLEAPTGLLGESMGGGSGGPRYQGGNGFVPIYDPRGGGSGIQSASLAVLLAQGLGDRLGLSVSWLRQWTLSGKNPFLSIEEFYLVRNPSSDEFSWEGFAVSSLATLNMPGDIELKMGYTYSDREYPGVEVMSPEGEPTGIARKDRRHLVEGRIEKDFRRFTVFVAYSRIVNGSNDPLFEWRSPFLMGGIEWSISLKRPE